MQNIGYNVTKSFFGVAKIEIQRYLHSFFLKIAKNNYTWLFFEKKQAWYNVTKLFLRFENSQKKLYLILFQKNIEQL
jgi:hypothetical protein